MINKNKILSSVMSLVMLGSAGASIAPSVSADTGNLTVAEVIDTPFWDIDFEDEIFTGLDGYPEYRYLSDKGGNRLSKSYGGASSTLTAHTGTTNNDISVEDSGDPEHGKAVKLDVADSRQVQFNEFHSRLSGGIIKSEWDMRFSKLPPEVANISATVLSAEVAPDATGRSEVGAIGIQFLYKDGVACFCDKNAEKIAPIEEGKWYNFKTYVDFDTHSARIEMDGVTIAEDTFDSSYTWVEKYRTSYTNCAGAEIWIDNFKTSKVKYVELNPGVTVKCDDAERSLPEGTLVDIDAEAVDLGEVSYLELIAEAGDGELVADTVSGSKGVFTVALSRKPVIYKVRAVDIDGNITAESESIELFGNPELEGVTVWDIDFENIRFEDINPDAPEYRNVCDSTGTRLTTSAGGAQSTLQAHTGSTDNDITIEDTGDSSHGNAVRLEVNDSKQVQFNEFRARCNGSAVKGEWDIMFEKLPLASSGAIINIMGAEIAPDPTGAKEEAVINLGVKYDDGVAYICYTDANQNTTLLEEIVLGKWYSIKSYIDFESAVATMFVNNRFAASTTFDSSLTWVEKYRAMFTNASGTVAWIDNFKVSSAQIIPVPRIQSVTSDDRYLYVQFVQPVSADVFIVDDGSICNITATYGDNELKFIGCSLGESPTTLCFTSDKKVFTAVPVDINITIPYMEGESADCFYTYVAPAEPFDVTNVDIDYDGRSYDIKAQLCNLTDKHENAVMIAAFYDKKGNTVAVRVSDILKISAGSKKQEISLSGILDAEYLNVFFINNWESSKAIKNIRYKN